MATNVVEDQGRCQVNLLVTRHTDICAADANDATFVWELRVLSLLPESAQAEVTDVISQPSPKGLLHQYYKAIKEGFRGYSLCEGVFSSQVTYRPYAASPCQVGLVRHRFSSRKGGRPVLQGLGGTAPFANVTVWRLLPLSLAPAVSKSW